MGFNSGFKGLIVIYDTGTSPDILGKRKLACPCQESKQFIQPIA